MDRCATSNNDNDNKHNNDDDNNNTHYNTTTNNNTNNTTTNNNNKLRARGSGARGSGAAMHNLLSVFDASCCCNCDIIPALSGHCDLFQDMKLGEQTR